MKKVFTVIGFMTLIPLSFIYTEKTASFLMNKDELMMTIKESASNYEVDAIDGKVVDNTFIPGVNGLEVNDKKSYKSMKQYGIFNYNLLEFNEVYPKNKLKDNYDKYIISGNSTKKMVTLIFKVEANDDIEPIIEILNNKNIRGNFFVDGYWFEQNNDKITELISNGHVIGNLSYNLNYNDGAFVWMDTIIKKIGKQKEGYCYAEVENDDNLKICALNKNYTIKPNIVAKDNYTRVIKENLKAGSIISLDINDNLKKELPVIINYITSKGYEIDNLRNLLSENNNSLF